MNLKILKENNILRSSLKICLKKSLKKFQKKSMEKLLKESRKEFFISSVWSLLKSLKIILKDSLKSLFRNLRWNLWINYQEYQGKYMGSRFGGTPWESIEKFNLPFAYVGNSLLTYWTVWIKKWSQCQRRVKKSSWRKRIDGGFSLEKFETLEKFESLEKFPRELL